MLSYVVSTSLEMRFQITSLLMTVILARVRRVGTTLLRHTKRAGRDALLKQLHRLM
jgi:hypothetical protein